MENKPGNKKIVSLNAELIADDISYAGIVELISGNRIYLIGNPSSDSNYFHTGTEIDLKLQLSSGNEIKLPCKVTWSYKTPPYGLTHSMGMEVLEQPREYIEFLNKLQ